MKIISKHKDFYDYLIQDHDADIVWERMTGLINIPSQITDYLDNFECGKYLIRTNKYKDDVSYNTLFPSGSLGNYYYTISNYIFGIFPILYSQPVLMLGDGHKNTSIILKKNLVDMLLDPDKEFSIMAGEEELFPIINERLQKFYEEEISLSCFRKSDMMGNIQDNLKDFCKKLECPDLFYKIEYPIFTRLYTELFIDLNSNSLDYIKFEGYTFSDSLVYNPIFIELKQNIIEYWKDELADIGTYNNIETFISTYEQEIIKEPDNKSKIINHGFDIKTSFRKM